MEFPGSYCGFRGNDPIPSTGGGLGNNRTVPPISYKRRSWKHQNVDNIRWFNESLGALLQTQNGASMVKPGSKRTTYQCTRVESSNICDNVIFKNVSKCKGSSPTNGLHGGTFFYQKDGGYPRSIYQVFSVWMPNFSPAQLWTQANKY